MSLQRILYVELNEDGTTGGSHQALLDLVEHLDRERYAPIVLCYQENRFVERYRAAGAEVHVWSRIRARERRVRGPWWMPYRPITQAIAIARRVRFLHRERIALVHINNSPSFSFGDWLPAARIVRVPCVSHVRGELDARPSLPAKLFVPRFDRLIAISSYVASRVTEANVPASRIALVPDGVDIAALRRRLRRKPFEIRSEFGVPPDAAFVVMVGHLRPWKGQHVLLAALAALDDDTLQRVHVLIAGQPDMYSPEYAERLHAVASDARLRGRVHFVESRSDIADLMSAATVVVHASTSAEPFGLVVVEAMALGRPVIAAGLGGPREIVTPASGWTFDPARHDALAALLRIVVNDPGALSDIGQGAARRAAEFSIGHTVAGVERLYESLLPATTRHEISISDTTNHRAMDARLQESA